MARTIVEWPTESQRRGGAWILLVVVAVLWAYLLGNRERIGDPQTTAGPLAERLADRVDPNLASAAELAAVPGVGEKKAAAMVAYREAFALALGAGTAFDVPADLENVPGIGEATAENIEPYLILPGERKNAGGVLQKAKKKRKR